MTRGRWGHRGVRTLAAVVLLMVSLPGCAREHPAGWVVLQLATGGPGDTGTSSPHVLLAGDSAVVALGGDSVVVRRAQMVVRQVALQPARTEECEPEEEDEEPCAQLEPGPLLLDLPLVGGAVQVRSVPAPTGAYSVLQVQIHPPDAIADSGFVTAHPAFGSASIRVDGSFSRSGARRSFAYASDFAEIQELMVAPPLQVQAGGTLRLTLRLELARLFLSADGTTLIDPVDANRGGPHDVVVRDNVRRALAAFRDENGDGVPDP